MGIMGLRLYDRVILICLPSTVYCHLLTGDSIGDSHNSYAIYMLLCSKDYNTSLQI